MKKFVLMVVALLCAFSCFSQVVDFEELTLQPNSSWVGSDGTGQFTSSYLTLYNNYNSSYSSWEGFAYTNDTDVETYDYDNISCAAGHGANNSANYAVCYVGSEWTPPYAPIPSGIKIDTEHSGDFTNRGAYFCMTYYCSKYISDNYPESHSYYKIKITAFTNGTELGNREVVMADYSEGNTYKMDEWTYVDLSWINGADSINFVTESNDPTYLTPNYFCMDDFGVRNPYPSVVDFEELTLQPNSSWVGSDETGRFTSSYLTLYNNYNSSYSSWEGFAYTNDTDVETYDYDNISCAAGHGANNSANYAVCYVGSEWTPPYAPIPSGIKIDTEHSGDFTNRGAYFCMTYYCSKYISDNYPESHSYYKIKITAFTNGTELGNREVVMADYSEGNTYKMDEWTYVDLSWINGADSINFVTESNDPTYLTPNYFCMDDFGAPAVPTMIGSRIAESLSIDAYFDAAGMLNLNCESRILDVCVYDMAGRLVKNVSANDNSVSMSVENRGMLIVSARTEKGMVACKVINNR